jgi:hypothetical protein
MSSARFLFSPVANQSRGGIIATLISGMIILRRGDHHEAQQGANIHSHPNLNNSIIGLQFVWG